MANHILQFSEILQLNNDEEKKWIAKQLTWVECFGVIDEEPGTWRRYEAGGREDDAELAGAEPIFEGSRFMMDYTDEREDTEDGFNWEFTAEGHLWLHSGSYSGNVERVAHLVHKFLKNFPAGRGQLLGELPRTWQMTWAATCDRPITGEFSGGSLVVTADHVYSFNARQCIDDTLKEINRPRPRQEQFGKLAWCAADVQTLFKVTEAEAVEFLNNNGKALRDRLCELGHGVIETLGLIAGLPLTNGDEDDDV